MLQQRLISAGLFITLTLCGCGGGSSESLLLQDPAIGLCSSSISSLDSADTDYQIDLLLAGDSVVCLAETAKLRTTVFAFDAFIADLPATEIFLSVLPAKASDEHYLIGFNRTLFEAIQYQSGSAEALRYYYSVSVDVDGDGKICNGDLRQDFDRTAFQSFPVSQESVVATMYMASISNLPCTD